MACQEKAKRRIYTFPIRRAKHPCWGNPDRDGRQLPGHNPSLIGIFLSEEGHDHNADIQANAPVFQIIEIAIDAFS